MVGIIKHIYGLCILSLCMMLFHAPPILAQKSQPSQSTKQVLKSEGDQKNTADLVIFQKLEKARQKTKRYNKTDKHVIISEYITNPLITPTLLNKKFHLRMYLMIHLRSNT